jgi:hypothetical protein
MEIMIKMTQKLIKSYVINELNDFKEFHKKNEI